MLQHFNSPIIVPISPVSTMLSANTPFKIHDENSTAGLQSVNKKNASKARQGPTTGGKIFGVAEDSFTPMKFGKDITATTTSKPRRALGEVSHNQLNQTAQKMASTPFQQIIKASTMKTTMKAGPGTMNIENAATVGSVQKVKFNLEPTIDDVSISFNHAPFILSFNNDNISINTGRNSMQPEGRLLKRCI